MAGVVGVPALGLATGDGVAGAAGLTSSTPFPNGQVTFAGHGWGPALGMGQWGAFGYAAQYHKTYQWILGHFYGGTKLVAGPKNPLVRVAIVENLGHPPTLSSQSAFHFGPLLVPAGHAARAVLDKATNRWRISEASACGQPPASWKIVTTNLVDPVATPASLSATAPRSKLLRICRADGVAMTVRGTVRAYDNSGGMRTLNVVRLEEYVADVTPSEASTGWATYGGGSQQGQQWGFQSLEAQAVAVRTYTLASEAGGGWYGYADICDTGCQTYPGVLNETTLGTLSATDTAGLILELPSGQAAPTEYSASTGGYTVSNSTWAGSLPFPEVPDAGDAVCLKTTGWTCNAQHDWTTSVAASTIQSTWPDIGTLKSVKVLTRYGSTKSSFGGRVATIEVVGSKRSHTLSGYGWANDFGFFSDWFAVTDGPGATTSAPSSRSAAVVGASRVTPGQIPLFQATGPFPSRARPGSSLLRARR